MKISIIIPLYNVEAYVAKCLNSVAAQDWDGDMECIIVDDCGSDSSVAIAEEFVASYSGPIRFVILHHPGNRGLSAARNTGMDASTGDYLLFIDSDDFITPDCVRLLSAPLKEKSYDLVVGNYKVATSCHPSNQIGEGEYDRDVMIPGLCTGKYQIAVWNKLYKKQLLSDYGIAFKEGLLFEDVLFSSEVVSVSHSMFAVGRVTYNYVIRSGSIFDGLDITKHIVHYHCSLSEYVKFVEKNKLWDEKNVCDVLRFIFHQCLYGPLYSFKEYKKYRKGFFRRYKSARRIMDRPAFYFVKADGRNFIHQIQVFHFILHPIPGAICYFVVNLTAASGIKSILELKHRNNVV